MDVATGSGTIIKAPCNPLNDAAEEKHPLHRGLSHKSAPFEIYSENDMEQICVKFKFNFMDTKEPPKKEYSGCFSKALTLMK